MESYTVKKFKTVLFLFMLLPVPVLATGTFYYINGIYEHHFDLKNEAEQNNVGTITSGSWDTKKSLSDKEWGIDCASTDFLFAPKTYFDALYLIGSPTPDGWQSIDEYWDMKAQIFMGGKVNEYIDLPFTNQPNGFSNFRCNTTGRHLIGDLLAISNTDPLWTTNDLSTGSKGYIYFRLKKKIVNGYSFLTMPVLSIIGFIGEKSNSNPFIMVSLDAFQISLPEKCEINAGQTLDVNFGNVSSTKLDGSNYAKNVSLNVKCDGGDFDSGLNEVSTEYIGTPTFNDQYFGSDNDKVAVMVKDQDNSIIKPGDKKKLNLINGENDINLTLSPVSDGKNLDAGEFNANVIIRLNLE